LFKTNQSCIDSPNRENAMTLRDTRPGTIIIAAVVAAAAWYAKFPDSVQRCLPQLQWSAQSQNPTAFVFAKKVYWSPDSRKLLSVAHGEVGQDGPLALHDLDDQPYRMPIDMSDESVVSAVLAADGRHVLVITFEGHLWWIGLESDERTLLLDLPAQIGISAAALSPDGKCAVAACFDGSIYVCETERPGSAIFASGLTSRISELRFSSDGRKLVSAGQDGWLCVWELRSGELLHRWKGHDQPTTGAAFLPDGRIISASLDDTIRIWDMSTGREIWRGDFGLYGVTALAISADGKSAAWGGYNRKVIVWDLANARKNYEFEVPVSIVRDLKFSPDNNSLAVAGSEGMLRVHDAHSGNVVAEIELGIRI
jgi:WD40 repeat protein